MAASEAEPPPPKGAPMKKGLFYNPWRTWHEKSLSDVLRWTMERRQMKVSRTGFLMDNAFPSAAELAARFPVKRASQFAPLLRNSVEAVWVGHATVLAHVCRGKCFRSLLLTDPMFSSRCSPVQWAGPARIVPPAMQIEDLPSLDFVLISHNHYDHLDSGSVHRLHRRFGQSLQWYVPLGLKKWFNSEGINNVIELDWWQTVEHLSSPADIKKGTGTAATHTSPAGQQADVTADSSTEERTKTTITMTPAQHWSVRGLADRYKSLWGGYCVVHKAKDSSSGEADLRFWFAGDSGYCDVFKEIGQRLGPIDVSAIPIGAYEPRWFMKAQHVNPEEAVQIHMDTRSRQSLAIHCCTFNLSSEALDAPPRELRQALDAKDIDPSAFLAVQHGESLVFDKQASKLSNRPQLL